MSSVAHATPPSLIRVLAEAAEVAKKAAKKAEIDPKDIKKLPQLGPANTNPSLPGSTYPGGQLEPVDTSTLNKALAALVEDDGAPNVPIKPPFKDLREDPSILPVDIDNGTAINIKEPKTFTPKPDGLDQRQEVVIEPSPQEVIDFVNNNAATSLPPPPPGSKPKITLVNHSYHNEQYPPNFKIEIRVGKNDFVVGFDPSQGPGRPNFSGGHVSFPPGTVVIPKDLYNSILGGKTPDFRLSPDGNIEQLVDGKWVMYMSSHWPYGQK